MPEAGETGDGVTTLVADGSASGASARVLHRASRALGWSLLNSAVSRLGTLGIGIALARILGPEEFGTFAVAVVALLAVLSFNELGVSLAIVRWPSDPSAIAPTVTTMSTATSALIAVGGVVGAPWFASAMGAPDATIVVQVMMTSVLINGLVAGPAALMQRHFMQARRMMIDQVNVWLGAIVSIVLAVLGMGAMSLAVGRVVGSAASGLLFLVYSPQRYRFGFDRSRVRALLRFGTPLAGASVIVFAVGYADQLVTGRTLGPVELGFYVLAFNLASWPASLFSQPLRSVAPAAFSALQHDRRQMRDALTSIVGVLAAVTLPCCLVLGAAAGPVVGFVYGRTWAPAASALTWLAVMAIFKIFFELAYDYLVVLGRSGALLRVQVVFVIALVPSMLLGGKIAGIAGIAAAQVAVAAVVVLPIYLAELHRVGVGASVLGRRMWLAAVVGVTAAAAALLLSRTVAAPLPATVLAGLVILAACGGLLYVMRAELSALRAARPGGAG